MAEQDFDPELDRGPWALFLGGKWTRTQPTKPGLYPVATLYEGAHVGHRLMVKRNGKVVQADVPVNQPGWQGWFWSQPLPPMPQAPQVGE